MLCPTRSMLVQRVGHWVKNLVKGHRTLQGSGRARVSLLAGERRTAGVLAVFQLLMHDGDLRYLAEDLETRKWRRI